MLIRRYVNASFRLMMRTKWDADVCERHNAIMTGDGGPLKLVSYPDRRWLKSQS